jgi:hypothetical protein
MPRYFFHVHDGKDILDLVGTELPSPDAARAAAVIACGEALSDLGEDFWKSKEWTMRVVDEAGAKVCELTFAGKRM